MHRHALNPWRVVGLWLAMHQRMRVDSLSALFVDQVGKKHLHSPAIGGVVFADMENAQCHVAANIHCLGADAPLIWALAMA
ncbi:hypothetical protein SDC9_120884 [bioreactor metagenome]|uniref:Uncharacterized protein n=1 Tax=bioreactor metagenome TaxID=1076179 RepID=A0A645CAE5_9ZZZZ